MKALIVACGLMVLPTVVYGQARVVAVCGAMTGGPLRVGSHDQMTMDPQGELCSTAQARVVATCGVGSNLGVGTYSTITMNPQGQLCSVPPPAP